VVKEERYVTEPYVRPDTEAFLTFLNALPGPRTHEMSPPEARAAMIAMRDLVDAPVGELAVIRDLTLPGPAGDVPARLFDAREARAPGPVLVFFHGGGWVIGNIDSHAPFCAEAARILDLPVVSIDYRLAPEAPWPAAPDDCEAAARWVASAPSELGRVATGLILAGDSAGGNLAIVTAMALRDVPAAVPVIAQFPIYPATDMEGAPYPSYASFAEGKLLTREGMEWFTAHYAAEKDHVRASPIRGDLSGLPPALVLTASLDPIRDQGRAYAAALAQAGVPVVFREAQGNIHGFISLAKGIPSSRGDIAGALTTLKALIVEAEADRVMAQAAGAAAA
jgi:acetyl esterase